MNHFKTQQEIWKYVADGGSAVHLLFGVIRFENGELKPTQHLFTYPEDWSPYHEPVAKTKVWRWEIVTRSSKGNPVIYQHNSYYTEADAARYCDGYTKVPGSEREI